MTESSTQTSPFDYESLLEEFKGCGVALDMTPNLSACKQCVDSKYDGCVGSTRPLNFSENGFYLFCRTYRDSVTRLVQIPVVTNQGNHAIEDESTTGSKSNHSIQNNIDNLPLEWSASSQAMSGVEFPLSHSVNDMSKLDSQHVIVAIKNAIHIWARKADNFGFVDYQSSQILQEKTPIHLVVPNVFKVPINRMPFHDINEPVDVCESSGSSGGGGGTVNIEDWSNCLVGSRDGLSCIPLNNVSGIKLAHFTESDIVTSMKWNHTNTQYSNHLFSATWDEGALKFYDLRTTTTKPISSQYVQKGLFDHIFIDDGVNHTIACGGVGGIIHLFDDRNLCKPLFLQIDPFNQDIYEFSSTAYDVINSGSSHQELEKYPTKRQPTDYASGKFEKDKAQDQYDITHNQNGLLCFGLNSFTVWNYDRRSDALIFRDMHLYQHPNINKKIKRAHVHGLFTFHDQAITCTNRGVFQEWNIKPFTHLNISTSSQSGLQKQAQSILRRQPLEMTNNARADVRGVEGDESDRSSSGRGGQRKYVKKNEVVQSAHEKKKASLKPQPPISSSPTPSPLSQAVIVHTPTQGSSSSSLVQNDWDWDLDFHHDWSPSTAIGNGQAHSPQAYPIQMITSEKTHQGGSIISSRPSTPKASNSSSIAYHDDTKNEGAMAGEQQMDQEEEEGNQIADANDPVISVNKAGETVSAQEISEKADELFLTNSKGLRSSTTASRRLTYRLPPPHLPPPSPPSLPPPPTSPSCRERQTINETPQQVAKQAKSSNEDAGNGSLQEINDLIGLLK